MKDKVKIVQLRQKKEEKGKELSDTQKSCISLLKEVLKSAEKGEMENLFVVGVGDMNDGSGMSSIFSGFANLSMSILLLGAVENNKIRLNESIEEYSHSE